MTPKQQNALIQFANVFNVSTYSVAAAFIIASENAALHYRIEFGRKVFDDINKVTANFLTPTNDDDTEPEPVKRRTRPHGRPQIDTKKPSKPRKRTTIKEDNKPRSTAT
jgi:hypothetical protein